nr:type I DNA topoisomerase [secondary endosymbiont of Trabutina mannipara]
MLPGKEKIIIELKKIAKEVNHIYLATDLDREGEAIAWHLRKVIGGNNTNFSRVVFNEITHNAIIKAFKFTKKLNINYVNAQQTRRFMDRIIGYMISPLLCKKISRGLSAGRVQSVAVKLVVERERKIKSFVSEEYYKLYAYLKNSKNLPLTLQVTHKKEKIFKPKNKNKIKLAIDILKKIDFFVINSFEKITFSKPSAPFTTATLQQAANVRLNYNIKKTMLLAQQLYEAGYITYMRTDSTHLSQDAINMAREYILKVFGKSYLSKKERKYTNKNNLQEAHEAIRPSYINIISEKKIKNLKLDAQNLYNLIFNQFIACQMMSAKYNFINITVKADNFKLHTSGRTLLFDGWIKIMPLLGQHYNDKILPILKIGEKLKLIKLIPNQCFTKPPVRYCEASLVKELEKKGIGRPSTYVSIITTIKNRGYVHTIDNRFYAKKIGEIVTDRLEESFNELISYDFTAKMENNLDLIAINQQYWKNVLNIFFKKFLQKLEIAKKDPKDGGMQLNKSVITDIDCSICKKKMMICTTSTGVFLGCSSYTMNIKEKCKNTINLIPKLEILNIIKNFNLKKDILLPQQYCHNCNTIMDCYIIYGQHNIFYICGKNPLCNGYKIKKSNLNHIITTKCKKCSYNMYLKQGCFGNYMLCINDTCKNTIKILSKSDIATL